MILAQTLHGSEFLLPIFEFSIQQQATGAFFAANNGCRVCMPLVSPNFEEGEKLVTLRSASRGPPVKGPSALPSRRVLFHHLCLGICTLEITWGAAIHEVKSSPPRLTWPRVASRQPTMKKNHLKGV